MPLPTKFKFRHLTLIVGLWIGIARPSNAQEPNSRETIAVSSDLQMIYEKTETASSVSDFSSIFTFCKNVSADRTRSNEDQQYARALCSWAANKRGEARSDEAGQMVRMQQITEASEMDALALKDFELAIQLDNTRWRAHHNLAIIRAVRGDHAAAIQGFNRVVELNPDFADAYFNRGEVHFQLNQFEKAIADYNKVIEAKPNDSSAYSARAHVLYASGKTKDALNDYVKAMELSPESVDAITEFADTCQALGKWKEAAEAYQQAMQLDGQHTRTLQNAAWMMATCPDDFYRDGKTALAKAKQVIQASGSSAQSLDVLAAAQAASGDFATAKSTLDQALSIATDPSLRNEMTMRSKLYQRKRIYTQPNR